MKRSHNERPPPPWSPNDDDLVDLIGYLPYALPTWAIMRLKQTVWQLQEKLCMYKDTSARLLVTKRTRLATSPAGNTVLMETNIKVKYPWWWLCVLAATEGPAPCHSPPPSPSLSDLGSLGSLTDLSHQTPRMVEAATMTINLLGVACLSPLHSWSISPPPASTLGQAFSMGSNNHARCAPEAISHPARISSQSKEIPLGRGGQYPSCRYVPLCLPPQKTMKWHYVPPTFNPIFNFLLFIFY